MSAEQNRAVGMFSKPSSNHQHHFPKGVS
jgi:hypothetical protein